MYVYTEVSKATHVKSEVTAISTITSYLLFYASTNTKIMIIMGLQAATQNMQNCIYIYIYIYIYTYVITYKQINLFFITYKEQ